MAHDDGLHTAALTAASQHLLSARDVGPAQALAILLLLTVIYTLNAYARPREHPRKPLLSART